jgi:hypothetical protein
MAKEPSPDRDGSLDGSAPSTDGAFNDRFATRGTLVMSLPGASTSGDRAGSVDSPATDPTAEGALVAPKDKSDTRRWTEGKTLILSAKSTFAEQTSERSEESVYVKGGSLTSEVLDGRGQTRIVAPEEWLPSATRDSAPALYHAEPTQESFSKIAPSPAEGSSPSVMSGTLVFDVAEGARRASDVAEVQEVLPKNRAGVSLAWIASVWPRAKAFVHASWGRFLQLPRARQIQLCLFPVALLAAAFVFLGGSPAPRSKPAAQATSKPAESLSKATSVAPQVSVASAVVAPVSIDSRATAAGTQKTLERQAADALAEGNDGAARRMYETLAKDHPDNDAYRAVLKLLDRRLAKPR